MVTITSWARGRFLAFQCRQFLGEIGRGIGDRIPRVTTYPPSQRPAPAPPPTGNFGAAQTFSPKKAGVVHDYKKCE